MKVTIKGKDKLLSQFGKIPKAIEDAIFDATFEIVEDIQGRVESELNSSIKYNRGDLAGSNKNEVVKDTGGNIIGRVWNDNPVAVFREFGAGRVGEASQKDLPPDVNPTYTQEMWFFPVELVDIDLTEIYGMQKITIQGKEFYRTNGQPARPFMYPSFKEGVAHADEVYKEHVQKHLRKGLK